jgi:peroxiredoxin
MSRASRLIAILALAAQVACDTRNPPIEVGRPLPPYGAVTLARNSVQVADLRGKVVFLNVWATWCIPCRDEMPALEALYERNAARGLEMVGVSVDSRNQEQSVQRFVEEYHVTYPIWYDPAGAIYTRFRIIGVPASFLIDREGVLRWRHMGPVTVDDPDLTAALEVALGEG